MRKLLGAAISAAEDAATKAYVNAQDAIVAAAVATLDTKVDTRTRIPVLTAKTAAFTIDATMLYCNQLVNRSAGNYVITVPTPASIGAVKGDWLHITSQGTSQGTLTADTAPTPDVVVSSYGGALKTLGQFTKLELEVIDDTSSGIWYAYGQITT